MSVNTILLDFSLDAGAVRSEPDRQAVAQSVEGALRDFLKGLKLLAAVPVEGGDLLKVYGAEGGVSLLLRVFATGLVTINVDLPKCGDLEVLSFEACKKLEVAISKLFAFKRTQSLAPIKRGIINRFYPTCDDRLLEYDIDALIFEERTQFQKIQIVHSKSLGNMLILDDLQNISEADLIYTETLMSRGTETYTNKEIIILGGGDGALLFELLKEHPKEVIMLEIDEVVMKACAQHMRSICGEVLDRRHGKIHKIIVGDCMNTLEHYIDEGRKFDYVFGDLTDVPLSAAPVGEIWDFTNKVLEQAFKILKPDGKFMTHVTGSAAESALKMYELELSKLKPKVKFTTSHAFIPSFLEDWVFYQVSFDSLLEVEDGGDDPIKKMIE